MNNKQFLTELSGKCQMSAEQAAQQIQVNPTTGVRMLVPPKLVLTYKPSSILKEKLK